MSTYSTQSKSAGSFVTVAKAELSKTWDQALMTWDQAVFTWDQVRDFFVLVTKNSSSHTNPSRLSGAYVLASKNASTSTNVPKS